MLVYWANRVVHSDSWYLSLEESWGLRLMNVGSL